MGSSRSQRNRRRPFVVCALGGLLCRVSETKQPAHGQTRPTTSNTLENPRSEGKSFGKCVKKTACLQRTPLFCQHLVDYSETVDRSSKLSAAACTAGSSHVARRGSGPGFGREWVVQDGQVLRSERPGALGQQHRHFSLGYFHSRHELLIFSSHHEKNSFTKVFVHEFTYT